MDLALPCHFGTPLSAAVFSKMLGDISLNNRQDAKKRKSIAALS
jgi:hypothetical protein